MARPMKLITADLPGLGGTIKVEPTDFVVEEMPLYAPCGEGHHVYVTLTREGQTTRTLQEGLQRLFGLREVDIGCAGLKDKQARATQTFSLLTNVAPDEVRRRIEGELSVTVDDVARHINKLKRGHLLGNRFRILVTGAAGDPAPIAAALRERGCPNYYGPQRFGFRGDNAQRGLEALRGRGPRKRWEHKFLLSALQADLFNRWLDARIERGWYDRLLAGDVAKKRDTGGLFTVEGDESARFERREIDYTGPIYGHEMMAATGEPGALEAEVLAAAEIDDAQMKRAKLNGSRRPSRIWLGDLLIEPAAAGLWFSFSLPKGSYATTVLREFTKTDVALPDE